MSSSRREGIGVSIVHLPFRLVLRRVADDAPRPFVAVVPLLLGFVLVGAARFAMARVPAFGRPVAYRA